MRTIGEIGVMTSGYLLTYAGIAIVTLLLRHRFIKDHTPATEIFLEIAGWIVCGLSIILARFVPKDYFPIAIALFKISLWILTFQRLVAEDTLYSLSRLLASIRSRIVTMSGRQKLDSD